VLGWRMQYTWPLAGLRTGPPRIWASKRWASSRRSAARQGAHAARADRHGLLGVFMLGNSDLIYVWFHGFWDMELDLWVGRAGQWVVPAALGQRLLPRRGVGRLVGPPGWSPWGAGVFPECGYASYWKVLVRTSSSRPLLGWSLTRRHSKATPLRDTPFCARRAGLKRPLDLPNGPV
jgi:hypothetical protein